jgi:hypothetical protein
VLTSSRYDHAAIARSAHPVSDFNYWLLYEDQKSASPTVRLKSTLRADFLQARLANSNEGQEGDLTKARSLALRAPPQRPQAFR